MNRWIVVVFAALLTFGPVPGSAMAQEPGPSAGSGSLARPVPAARAMSLAQARLAAATGMEVGPSAAGTSTGRRLESAPGAVPTGSAEPALSARGSKFTPMSPVRVLDTRNGTGGFFGPVGPGVAIQLNLSAQVPATATAVVLNLTGTAPTAATYVTVYPSDGFLPLASNLNLVAGQTRANAVTVGLGAGALLNLYNNAGSVHLVADLAGYYSEASAGGFATRSPTRVLDTRTSGGPLGPAGVRTIDLSGLLPATATAVTFNLTGVGATANTYVTAWPDGTARPLASSLNLGPGQTVPNLVTMAVGPTRRVSLYNNVGSTHLIVDLAGHYATDGGLPFYQLAPERVLDTRPGFGLGGGVTGTMELYPWLPNGAQAAVFNLTGINASSGHTFVTAWPAGTSRPVASNLNLAPSEIAPNLVTVALGIGSGISFYNNVGYVDLVMDLAGYFAPPPYDCESNCVHVWGDNTYGQLGIGTTGGWTSTPVEVPNMFNASDVTASAESAYAVGLGPHMAWGRNDVQNLGTYIEYGMEPVPVEIVTDGLWFTSIAAGYDTAYARASNGEAYAWGYNGDGELGDGSTEVRVTPQRVSLPADVVAVAGGYATGYALRSDGTVWAWGANGGALGNGQYGTGCETIPVGPGCRALTPIQVPGLTDIVAIGANWFNAYAVRGDGTVWIWGWNAEGELGIGTVGGPNCYANPTGPNCVALSPVQIPNLSGVTKVVGGVSTSYALKSDGTVSSWGWNTWGQLGNGTAGGAICNTDMFQPNCYSAVPVGVSGLTGVTDVAAGRLFGQALRNDGTVWSWGDNRFGQLGRPAASSVPLQVPGLAGVTAIGAGGYVGMAVVP